MIIASSPHFVQVYIFSMLYQISNMRSVLLMSLLQVDLSLPILPILKLIMASLLLTLILVISISLSQTSPVQYLSFKILYVDHCPLVTRIIPSSNSFN